MLSVVLHALLGMSVASLAGSGLRVASVVVDRGLERILAAVTFACAIAVLHAVLLGALRLGSSPVTLFAAAALTWATARRLLPAPALRPSRELGAWAHEASSFTKAAAGALAALGTAWLAWFLARPYLGVDVIYYHFAQVNRWIHNGTPGAADPVNYLFQVEAYPLVNQVLLGWSTGIARSMVPLAVFPICMYTLLLVAGWVGLRAAHVPLPPRVLCITAVALMPVTLNQLQGPLNDVPALTWLVVTAALCTAARDRRALLVPAVVAAGLSVGTKTTVLPAVIGIAVVCALVYRGQLRHLTRALVAAAIVALVVGGFWYARTTVMHGSPFWPWAATPWGDPTPDFLARTYSSILEKPRETLQGRWGAYASFLGGGAILLAGAASLPFGARSRRAIGVACATLALAGLWAVAPSTAITEEPAFDGSISQLRYLLPALTAGALAVALVARSGRRWSGAASLTFVAAIVWSVFEIAGGGAFVGPPPARLVLPAVAMGGAVAWYASPTALRAISGWRVTSVVILVAALLAVPAASFTERYARVGEEFDAGLVRFFSGREDFRRGTAPIFMAPVVVGTLSGDRLQHEVILIPRDESCPAVARRLEQGWVVLGDVPLFRREVGYTSGDCLRELAPVATVGRFRIYEPRYR